MKFPGVVLSAVLHISFALGLWWAGSHQMTIQLGESPPCTIPLEVTATADVSQAPISKPKVDNPGDQKRSRGLVEDILPEQQEAQPKTKPQPEKQWAKPQDKKPDDVPPLEALESPKPEKEPIKDKKEPEKQKDPGAKNLDSLLEEIANEKKEEKPKKKSPAKISKKKNLKVS
jgi:hypothetical protein